MYCIPQSTLALCKTVLLDYLLSYFKTCICRTISFSYLTLFRHSHKHFKDSQIKAEVLIEGLVFILERNDKRNFIHLYKIEKFQNTFFYNIYNIID